jgi:phage/plasmid-like protein (TIGR03299 family)
MSTNLLDNVIDNTVAANTPIVQNDIFQINFVAGMTDPGEMIRCGYRPELRRKAGEQDKAYADRIRPLVMALPQAEKDIIMTAAINRAGLDLSNGRVNVGVFGGDFPWHAVGTYVGSLQDSGPAAHLSGTDFELALRMLTIRAKGPEDSQRIAEGIKAIVRTDTGAILGYVQGGRYKLIQPKDGFKFVDAVLAQYGAKYESAGSLDGGRQVFMQATLPEPLRITKNDVINTSVLFTADNTGKGADYCLGVLGRAVCKNTMRMLMAGKYKGIRIPHLGDIREKISKAQEALGIAVEKSQEFGEQARSLVQKKVDIKEFANRVLDQEAIDFGSIITVTQAQMDGGASAFAAAIENTEAKEKAIKAFDRAVEKREGLLDLILNTHAGERCGIDGIRGSAWSCVNAITEVVDHHKLGKESADPTLRANRRFESVLVGAGDDMKQLAFQQAMAY